MCRQEIRLHVNISSAENVDVEISHVLEIKYKTKRIKQWIKSKLEKGSNYRFRIRVKNGNALTLQKI